MKLFKKIALLSALTVSLALSACGSKADTSGTETDEVTTAADDSGKIDPNQDENDVKEQMLKNVADFCADFKNKDYAAMYALTQDGTQYFSGIYQEGTSGGDAIFDTLSDKLEYEVIDCTIDGDNASVNTKISNINMEGVMTNALTEFYNECEENPSDIDSIDFDAILTAYLMDENAEKYEADTVFNYIKQDGKWVLESNVMIYDDLAGGYLTWYFKTNVVQ